MSTKYSTSYIFSQVSTPNVGMLRITFSHTPNAQLHDIQTPYSYIYVFSTAFHN